MTKCLFNALLFTVMEIVFPALLHQKSGSVTLTLFWAKLCISRYDSQIKTFCWHSSRALSRAGSPNETLYRGMVMASVGCAISCAQGSASRALKCPGTEQREALPSWCTTVLLFPGDTSTQLTEQGMKCLWISSEVWNTGRGGKWITGMEKNTATPQRRYGEIPGEEMVFHWRKWMRREKAHKKSNEKKAKYIISSPFCFPFTPQSPPKAEPILFLTTWPSKLELMFTKLSFFFFFPKL